MARILVCYTWVKSLWVLRSKSASGMVASCHWYSWYRWRSSYSLKLKINSNKTKVLSRYATPRGKWHRIYKGSRASRLNGFLTKLFRAARVLSLELLPRFIHKCWKFEIFPNAWTKRSVFKIRWTTTASKLCLERIKEHFENFIEKEQNGFFLLSCWPWLEEVKGFNGQCHLFSNAFITVMTSACSHREMDLG